MDDESLIAHLLERCRRDQRAWFNGDPLGYRFPDDGTIMGPFGGVGIGGATIAAGQRRAVEAFLTGTGEIELIRATVAGDVAWLLLIERSRVEFAGYDEPQPWELRVTEVFRRTGGDWERVHRHADPLVNRRTLAETLKFRA